MAITREPVLYGAATRNEAELRLMRSALLLFSERGYTGTSIREIIEGAGVTRPVLYYYFKNKEDLFCQLVESSFAALSEEMDEILAATSGCRARLKALMRVTFQRAQEYPAVVGLILQVFFAGQQQGIQLDTLALAQQRFEPIARVMREGLVSAEVMGGDAETLALAFSGIMDMHIMAKAQRPEGELTAELADGLVDMFLDGACCEERRDVVLRTPFPAEPGDEA
ncbi:MAG: TetR family transcriptional regulator [Nitrospiraceae bacterium]|nr:TetR family transcriptional regulator [Nitrospiraceae bacterium]